MNVGNWPGGAKRQAAPKNASPRKRDWKCPGCRAWLRYYWTKCPNCNHPRP